MGAVTSDVDLFAPFERDTVLEVRTSTMKTMPGLSIQSGIDKELRSGRIKVSFKGLDADEHDLTFHGGPDKAVHGYCSSHYPQWRSEFPEAAGRFKPGGFGENFVTARMNERNVCIGDIMSVGTDGVLLQVSLPRQPCFKLNHRFQLKNFAPNTYKFSRTGWYYRVIAEGTIQAGDEIRLVERKWPDWTIERIQEFLHRNPNNPDMNEALASIESLGDESRNAFRRRVAKHKKAQQEGDGAGGEVQKWVDYKIVEKKSQTPRISSFILEAVKLDPEAAPMNEGSHARLRLPNGLIRSYSIVSGDNANRFELGIALDSASRGGSAYLHNTAAEGDILQVGRVTADVKPAMAASNHVFIVGGIGITAFLVLMEAYREVNLNTTLHYAVRDSEDIPFRSRVDALNVGDSSKKKGGAGSQRGEIVRIYDGKSGSRMDIPAIFRDLTWNSHVYVCGPQRMMDEAARAAREAGLGPDDVHYEAFGADTTGDPFEVEVQRKRGGGGDDSGSGSVVDTKHVKVGEEETLLDALRKCFDDVDVVTSSCEVGNCGTCKVALKCGRVDHRGTALTDEEKKTEMLSCVSRGVGKITVEI